ncbi:MAG: hypothetical protein U5K84_12940 [Alkalibacterium sp.]|nr:hypothetical protein [Alkalibacterium sp.]
MIQQYFLVSTTLYAVLSVLFIYRHTLQGLGNSFAPTVAGIGELLCPDPGCFYPVPDYLGFTGIVLANRWPGSLLSSRLSGPTDRPSATCLADCQSLSIRNRTAHSPSWNRLPQKSNKRRTTKSADFCSFSIYF